MSRASSFSMARSQSSRSQFSETSRTTQSTRATSASRWVARDASANVDNTRYGPVWDEPPASCACCVCCGASTASASVRLLATIFTLGSVGLLVAGMILKNAVFNCGDRKVLDFALWEVKGSASGDITAYSDAFVLSSRILFLVGGTVGALAGLLLFASVFVVCCFCIQRRREDIYSPEGRHAEAERQRRDRGLSFAALFFACIAAVVEIPAIVIVAIWYTDKMPKLSAPSSSKRSEAYRKDIASCGGDGKCALQLGFWLLVAGVGCAVVALVLVIIDVCIKPDPTPLSGNNRDAVSETRRRSSASSAAFSRGAGSYNGSMRSMPSQRGSFYNNDERRPTVAAPVYPMQSRNAINPLYDEKGSRMQSRSSSMRYYQ